MDRFSQPTAPRHSRRHPVNPTLARFAVAFGPLLLAAVVLSACRQEPTPKPLPKPITFTTAKTLTHSAFPLKTVA